MNEKANSGTRHRIVLAAAFIAIGLVFMIWKSAALDLIVMAFGIIVLVSAAAYLIMFLRRRKAAEGGISLLISCIALAAAGIIFLVRPDFLVNFFPFVMGIILIVGGIYDLALALTLKKAGTAAGTPGIFMSVVVLILGILITAHPGAVADMIVVLTGLTMLISGISTLTVSAGQKN